MSANADQNMLFGILALQMDFIDRDQLITAMNAWVLNKSQPLDQVLADQGALDEDARTLLAALVQKHIAMHDGQPDKSLAAVSSIGSVRDQLKSLGDPDVEASLQLVSASRSSDDPESTLSMGQSTSLGERFRILRPHAKGGLGMVSLARDNELDREVALKEIQDRYADDGSSRERFTYEAMVTGGLEHPGIVPVYGLGQYDNGRPYYAMRFIRGDSLKEAIKRFHKDDQAGGNSGQRRLERRKLLGRFVDVCHALEYAHSRGVLHRDLKPGNIMLGKYGETLVVDWGLAKTVERDADAAHSEEPTLRPRSGGDSAPTQMGSVVGTPGFLSPEQAAGRLDLIGPATDVFGLGATLYCLANTRSMLGAALTGTGNLAEAEPLLLDAHKTLVNPDGESPDYFGRNLSELSLARLVKLYNALDRPEEAAKWQTELDKRNAAAEAATSVEAVSDAATTDDSAADPDASDTDE